MHSRDREVGCASRVRLEAIAVLPRVTSIAKFESVNYCLSQLYTASTILYSTVVLYFRREEVHAPSSDSAVVWFWKFPAHAPIG